MQHAVLVRQYNILAQAAAGSSQIKLMSAISETLDHALTCAHEDAPAKSSDGAPYSSALALPEKLTHPVKRRRGCGTGGGPSDGPSAYGRKPGAFTTY
jgi:hypothetical protein